MRGEERGERGEGRGERGEGRGERGEGRAEGEHTFFGSGITDTRARTASGTWQ